MNKDMHLSYITLPVDDLARVKAWYVEQIDLDLVSETLDEVVVAGGNGFAVKFVAGHPLDHPERVHLAFHATDVDNLFRRLHDRGIPFVMQPHKTAEGLKFASAHDPAGHTIDIFEIEEEALKKALTL
jgi:catechol 2,3-dioxygenase-like lactoylglutathione lyase family enzyme